MHANPATMMENLATSSSVDICMDGVGFANPATLMENWATSASVDIICMHFVGSLLYKHVPVETPAGTTRDE